jgi:hypothetical protein
VTEPDPSEPPDPSQPPEPPELPRHLRLYRSQWIGVPLLMLVPVLALLGVFGESRARTGAAGAGLELEIDYPIRIRTGQRTGIDVTVRNRSTASAERLTVVFDTAYFQRVADVRFIPPTSAAFEVSLPPLAPGAEELVRVEFDAEQLWRQAGWIGVRPNEGDATSARIRTFIFP